MANKEKIPEAEESPKSVEESEEVKEQSYTSELRVNVVPKRAQSSHVKIRNSKMVKKMTKSAHMLGENQLRVVAVETVSCFRLNLLKEPLVKPADYYLIVIVKFRN